MSAIEFEVREGVDYTDVNEKGTGRYVGGFLGSMRKPDAAGDMVLTTHLQRAKAHAAFMTAEHAGGRVPQALCGSLADEKAGKPRTPCDYEQIHMPEMLTDVQKEALVFCKRHISAFGIAPTDANREWLAKQENKT